ncbi:PH and SEC7 domain-containing protein-like isoform X3 [Ruditapes philippinarum]|uniref:PH and SEC7 domain-containing protein-like isoform X3 n=1 Tax=Ruditapes philippinarum TaxID=129788 RepID=UPI00295BFEDC|nr:PH and SEC7 domain-containing protein-like isoform X3 [Ruditapes philippinarum]XP_060576364.1 PH and SEC7 domain-containing protein-like isoform X3 [Ruditapes philippinarum]XP_060576365.1 PH and SEC7 domain-containing protein-like isoform X3 [Ruditapes philippinarum]
MVDRIPHGPSRIPVPKSISSPKVMRNGKCGADVVVPIIQGEDCSEESNGCENGVKLDKKVVSQSPKSLSKVPKATAPKELLIDKGKLKNPPEKGFEAFLMTGDMIIKKNPSLKLRKLDGTGLERHHSDSSPYDLNAEKKAFKRSASSPDQSTFTGATVITNDNVTMDNISKALEDDDENSMNRKESAESGFEEQVIHSDSGTLEKPEKLPNDPNSVSDLSEVDSDDLLGNGNMVGSQTSAMYNVSTVSTPSDLRSETSVSTVLQQEVEPLLKEDSSSSSSIDISSTESFSGELTPELIYERSLSDSGGMSPVYQHDVKSLITCKSAEKILIQKQMRQIGQDCQGVRASKSQEQCVGEDFTFVSIDIDDTAYSLDQIPLSAEKTPTRDEFDRPVKFEIESPSRNKTERDPDPNDDRIFMPAFVKLDKSVHENSEYSSEEDSRDECSDMFDSDIEKLESNDSISDSVHDKHAQEVTQEFDEVPDNGAQTTDNKLHLDSIGDVDNFDGIGEVINQDDLFVLPPAKSVDQPSAMRLAKRLYNLDGFRKSDVSRHLSKKNDFSILVAEEYLKFFDFSGDTLDVALRKFLKQFSLIGETQERERILAHFSRHYIQTNPGTYNSEDACHTLVCAIMLLNTDLHGQAVGRKMTCNEFIENLAELNDGENFPKEVLKALYHAIKAEPIEWAPDDEFQDNGPTVGDDQRPIQPQPTPSLPNLPPVVGRNPFLDVPDPSQTTEYKKGYIMRKCCVDPDGRKTAVGKRSWKMYYVVLRDMILYLYKDEQALKKSTNTSSHNAVRVHHCLASKASDYTKKQHVFRLQTADWAEYLFQTSNTKECQEWIDTLNYVAAILSAPPLPGAVGSQKKFQRPLLPASYTRLNLQDQLRSIEERLEQTELDLQEHRKFPPEKGSKSSVIQHFLEKENYHIYEIGRLKTYVYLLQSRLTSHPELEPSLVETAIGEDEEGIKGVNPAIHSFTSPGQKKTGVVQHSISDRSPHRIECYPTFDTLSTLV